MLKKYAIMVVVGLGMFAGSLQALTLYDYVKNGDFKEVKKLVLSGKVTIDEGDVAVAALKGHVEIVEFFLKAHAPLDSEVMRSAVRGACAHKKMGKDYEKIVHMLLKAHAPFDKETVCMAVECGNMAIVKMLVDAMPAFSNGKSLTRLRSV